MTQIEIERLEEHYLNKFYHLLKFYETEILDGFRANEDVVGMAVNEAEKMVNALFNRKGSRMEINGQVIDREDAQIHVYRKSAQASNISEQNESIPVGKTQNSYKGTIVKMRGMENEEYEPALSTFTPDGRPVLTFFLSMIYEKSTNEVLEISLICMPNGELGSLYGNDPLKAGKNLGQARFCFSKTPYFKTFDSPEEHKRVKVIYFKKDMDEACKDKLKFYRDLL